MSSTAPWAAYADPSAQQTPPPAATTYRAPDGAIVTLPANQDPQAVMAGRHAQVGGGGSYTPVATTDSSPWQAYKDIADPSGLRPDFATGFANDFLKPGANVLGWVGQAPVLGQALDATSKLVNHGEGLGEAIQDYKNYLPQQAAKGLAPSALGSFAGSLAGTAPLGLIGGGAAAPVIQGALGGALLSDGSLRGTVGGAIGGGVTGGIGGALGHTVLQSVAPKLTPAVQTILGETPNFPFTMGQVAKGGLPSMIENVGKITPFGGEMIRARGNDALEAGVRGTAKIATAPGAAPAEGETGFDLTRELKKGYDEGYNGVRAAGPVPLDGQYAVEARTANQAGLPISQGGNLPDDLAQRFSNVVNREIGNRLDPTVGGFTAEGAADAKAGLNKEIRKLTAPGALGGNKSGPSLYESDYVDALTGHRDAIKGALSRSDPVAGKALSDLDSSYPAYKAFEDAVVKSTQNGTTPNGFATPQQLQAAVGLAGTKYQRATNFVPEQGVAPTPIQRMAAYTDALRKTLPRGYKEVSSPMNSAIEGGVGAGVVGSEVFHGGGPAIAATGGLLAGLYTRPVQQAIVRGLIGNAGRRAAMEARLGVPLTAVTTGPAAAALGGVAGGAVGPSLGGMIPMLPYAQPSP